MLPAFRHVSTSTYTVRQSLHSHPAPLAPHNVSNMDNTPRCCAWSRGTQGQITIPDPPGFWLDSGMTRKFASEHREQRPRKSARGHARETDPDRLVIASSLTRLQGRSESANHLLNDESLRSHGAKGRPALSGEAGKSPPLDRASGPDPTRGSDEANQV